MLFAQEHIDVRERHSAATRFNNVEYVESYQVGGRQRVCHQGFEQRRQAQDVFYSHRQGQEKGRKHKH